MNKILFALVSVLISMPALAQEIVNEPAPTGLRADGKIYVVAAVLLTILIGILIYVIRLDRKISKLEDR